MPILPLLSRHEPGFRIESRFLENITIKAHLGQLQTQLSFRTSHVVPTITVQRFVVGATIHFSAHRYAHQK